MRFVSFLLFFVFVGPLRAQPVPSDQAERLAKQAIQSGNPGRGAVIFASPKTACLSCHQVGKHGGAVGPNLTTISAKQTAAQLADSILQPKNVIADEFKAIAVVTTDGDVLQGYRVSETDDALVIRDTAQGKQTTIRQDEIEDIQEVGTLMPDGLLATLSDQDKYDLVAFMAELGAHKKLSLAALDTLLGHAHGHHPAEYDMPREPLNPAIWPSWQAHVNRDRVYDFYSKQARHFRDVQPRPHLLREFGSLDSSKYGHWGNQSDAVWASDAWNSTDLGSLLSGVFHGPGLHISRGVCVRIGKGDTALSGVFDASEMKWKRVWQDRFVKFTSVRHGFMAGLNQDGETIESAERVDLPYDSKSPKTYLGLYRHGRQVLFAYRVDDVEYIDTATMVGGKFKRTVAARDQHPDRDKLRGGPPQWPQTFPVKSQLGDDKNGPYVIDKIGLPIDNPWNALIFCGGHDFLSDGSGIVCTMQGDVWKATGLDAKLDQVQWRRIASGLQQALGLVIHDDQIYVLGRDQITRLHDLNNDGEMDFYECFSNVLKTSRGGHDFTCGLFRDDQGRFYTASGSEGVMRVSADGKQANVLATGLRNSDGIGITPDGLVTIPSSEGDWMPASMIAAVRPGGPVLNRLSKEPSAANELPFFGRPGNNRKQPPDLPMIYLPRGLDNSSGGQVHVGSDRFGPIQNQMVHLSYGAGTAFLLLRDEFDGWVQGAAVPLTGEFASGSHRGKFNPVDGQLYVSGMGGWGTYTTETGCFQRVRYTGKSSPLPIGFQVHENGILVEFSEQLDHKFVNEVKGHFAQAWNYRYSGAYGSPEYSTRQIGLRGHDVLEITSARVVGDGKRLFLEMPTLQPVNQLHLLIRTGEKLSHDLFMTVHRLRRPFTEFAEYVARDKVVLPHPMLADFTRPRAYKRNPYRKMISGTRAIELAAAKNLMFDRTQFKVKPGEPIRLSFTNPDAVPHNWALLKPGKLKEIGMAANRLIASPEAAANQYIPKSDAVIAYTDVVEPNGKSTIYFRAPAEPGRYPYLCTFPGHWMVMNGVMIVE